MDPSLVKVLLIILSYSLPLLLAIIFFIFSKKLSHRGCIFSGLLIIFLAAAVMPMINSMKGMDNYYQQKELLEAIRVVVSNQEILAAKDTSEPVVINKVIDYMSDNEKKDYSNFRAFIDTYEVFFTFLGLSLGVNILCLGFSNKLPSIQNHCECNKNDKLTEQVESIAKSTSLLKYMFIFIIMLLLAILLT